MKRKYTTPTKLVILALAMITIPTLLPPGAAAEMEEEAICSLYRDQRPENRPLWCNDKPLPELRFRHNYGHQIEDHLPGIIAFAVIKILLIAGILFAIWYAVRRSQAGPTQPQNV